MGVLREKSYQFALEIVNLRKTLSKKEEYVLSKQILRSGTSIGALVRESEYAQSKADFVNKLSIALKEANETDYWLSILKDSDYISEDEYSYCKLKIDELLRLLISSINTVKSEQKVEKNEEKNKINR